MLEADFGDQPIFPEGEIIKLIDKYKIQLGVVRVDLYMTYEQDDKYRLIIVSSTEPGYASNHRITFNVPQSNWNDEGYFLRCMPDKQTDRMHDAIVFVDGWYISYNSTSNVETTNYSSMKYGPISFVRIFSDKPVVICDAFRSKIVRQVGNALWLSRSNRFLNSTLLLQNLFLNTHATDFISKSLESLFEYIRADIVFSIQKKGNSYKVVKIVASQGLLHKLEGQEVPVESVFHPENVHGSIESPHRDKLCGFDKLILSDGSRLFASEACVVPATDSLVNIGEAEANNSHNNVPILHICVAGKRELEFEYQFFSETDLAILAQVAHAIAANLNTTKLASGYREINQLLSRAATVYTPDSDRQSNILTHDLPEKFSIETINASFSEIVHNISNFFIVSYADSKDELFFIEGDKSYFHQQNILNCINQSSYVYDVPGGYLNCVEMYRDDRQHRFYFCYRSVARHIARYKGELISFLINEFRVNFREHLELEKRVNVMAQFQHATKGPLAAVASALKMLSNRAELYDGNPSMLNRLSRTVAHKSALTDSILWVEKSRQLGDFAQKLVEGYSPDQIKWQDTTVSDIVKSAVELFTGYAKTRDKVIRLSVEPEIDGMMVSCDTRAIEVVIHNLIDNAIKYGHRGKTVIVELGLTMDASEWVFSVTDEGEPIPEADAESIYEVFRRSSDPRVIRRRSGMGLGLAVCKEILDTHYENNMLGFKQHRQDGSQRSTSVTFSFHMRVVGKRTFEQGIT